jgi:hypothetical protein
MTLKICVAQLNFTVGDFAGNVQKIVDAAHQAHAQGARLLLTPELSLCGYAAEDLYLRPAFMQASDDALKDLTHRLAGLRDMTVVVGHPQGGERRTPSVAVQARFNCASVLRDGGFLETRIDPALPDRKPMPRPDLRLRTCKLTDLPLCGLSILKRFRGGLPVFQLDLFRELELRRLDTPCGHPGLRKLYLGVGRSFDLYIVDNYRLI